MKNRLALFFRASPWANALTLLLLAAGAAQLLACAWFVRNSTSPDYATVVLMARHMAAGKAFPVFFYGQAYMGSLEPAVSALLCAVFGPSSFCVCLGTTLFGLALLGAAAWTGRRLAGPWGGVFTLLFLETTGYTWHVFMTSPHGGYALCALLTFAALAIPAFARYPARDAEEPLPVAAAAAFGFLGGLAFWNNWLAAPAFLVGGLVLLVRLRVRLFSPRLLVALLVPFFLGSLPWWLWMVRNGGGALNLQAGGMRPPGFVGLGDVLSREIPRYWGLLKESHAFWRGPIPWTGFLSIAAGVAALALRTAASARRFAWSCAIYVVLFHAVYAHSSFGAVETPRYLVPLVAPYAVLAGAGLAALLAWRPHARWTRFLPAALVAVLVLARIGLVAPTSLGVAARQLPAVAKRGASAIAQWRALAADSELKGRPGYTDFRNFGANWMSDESLCLVSATRWRYRPYLDQVEAAADPWVCGKFCAVENFVKFSGGSCRVRTVDGVRVVDRLRPPPPVEEIPWDPAWTVRDEEGRDVEVSLFDDDWSSQVTLASDTNSHCHVDVLFPAPLRILGVELLIDGELSARFLDVDEVAPDGKCTSLAKDVALQGWFWSGPRPFLFGPGERREIRWEPRPLSHLRISFVSRQPFYPIRLHGIHLLSDRQSSLCDIEAVRASAEAIRAAEPTPLRIHADRWLASQLGADPDPSLTAGYGSGNIEREPSYSYSRVDFSKPALIVVPHGELSHRVRRVLDRAGATFKCTEAGGASLFHIPAQTETNETLRAFLAEGRVRFLGGHLWLETNRGDPVLRTAPALATFGGGLFDLVAAAPETTTAHPGETVNFRFDWRLCAGRIEKQTLHVFVHGMRDGKIAFQGQTAIYSGFVPGPPSLPRLADSMLALPLPADLPPGDYALRICFTRGMHARRRMSVETDLPTRRRAVTLPATLRVEAASQ